MNDHLKVECGVVNRSNHDVSWYRGEQEEFRRIISDLRTEIEKLKMIKLSMFWNNDQSPVASSHR